MQPDSRIYSRIQYIFYILFAIIFIYFLVGAVLPTNAQETTPVTPTQVTPTAIPPTSQPGSPVEVNGKVLFYVRQRIGSVTAAERAALISKRITDLATNPFAPPVEITLAESSDGTDVMAGEEILLTVTDADARAVGMTRQDAAAYAAGVVQTTIETTRSEYSAQARLKQIGQTLLFIAILVIALFLINQLYHALVRLVEDLSKQQKGRLAKSGLLRNESTVRMIKYAVNIVRWGLIIVFLIFIIPLLLRLFPTTLELSGKLLKLVLTPLSTFWSWLVENQSNFITIGIIVLIAYVFIRLTRFFFKEIARGTMKLGGFDREWAEFTGRIVGFLIIVAALIIAFPYLPGSDSEAFKGITIFLGALFTLSSTSAVTNIVAGVIQTYTGAFRVGDVVKIGLNTGIVTQKRLLATRVRTFKNEEVSIPNGTVLNTDVVNYSVMARGKGLVLYSTVTIGYDASWRTVHELLIAAALATPDILEDPKPFVLQTSLNDYNISYQINCYTKHPERMMRIYSALHANIQEKFNQGGVEIMSPAFMGIRDANATTIPTEFRPADYQAPGFQIENNAKRNLIDQI